MLNPNDFKQSLWALDSLGAMPTVLVKVWELAKDPTSNLETVGGLLRNDSALAAGIIRISNSPYYAPTTFHSNLTSAIACIGMTELIRAINLSLAHQLFARDLHSYGISASDYWTGSVSAALVMNALAGHSGLNPEDAHTVGILHAIGRILINRVVEERRFTIYWDGLEPIQAWERASVGFDFAEAGAMLLEHWRFPRTMCETIRWQLLPEKVTEQVSMLGLLQFTRQLVELTGLNFENKDWQFPEAHPFVQASGLTRDSIAGLLSKCGDDLQNIRASVDLN
jgi:HD-like signal output (HDOD) protein